MKKHVKTLLAFVALSFFSLQAPLAVEAGKFHDLSKYMSWQDGLWILYQEYDCLDFNCNPFLGAEELSGIQVSKTPNGKRWHTHYSDGGQPGNWILGDKNKYDRNKKHLKMIGIKSNGETWSLNPPVKVPRKLKLKKPFVYNGIARNGDQKVYLTLSITIARVGIDVSTPAGDFFDCIQVKRIVSGGPEGGTTEIEIMAPGVGVVKRWKSDLRRVAEGFEDDAFEADTEYHEAIDYGVSSPPFP